MKLNIVSKTLADFIPAAGKGDFDMLTLDYAYSDPDVLYFLLASSQGHGAGLNWTNFVSPTLDSLLQQGRTTLNSKKAAKIYNKLQEYVNTQLIFLGVADPISLVGIRSTIKGYHINRTGQAAIQDFYIRTK